ncbi:MAG: hypothetical protein JW860_00390 [Sedimentisphaerales bacterium]|nr:hypothetical protein [Sedimentisphaerales bacterium]
MHPGHTVSSADVTLGGNVRNHQTTAHPGISPPPAGVCIGTINASCWTGSDYE